MFYNLNTSSHLPIVKNKKICYYMFNMTKVKRNTIIISVCVAVLCLIAWLCRIQRSGLINGWARVAIHCELLIFWAFTVKKRIINKHIQRYLIIIAVLFTFWTLLVGVKYLLLTNETLMRYVWYLYYIPQTIVPILALFSAMSVGKSENYKLNKKWNLLFIPAVICCLLVLTNDLHQLAFSFPSGELNSGTNYSHEIFYFITMGLILVTVIAFFAALLKQCRLTNKKTRVILPIIPMLLTIVYGVVYVVNYDLIAVIAGDMKAVIIYLVVLSLEFCIDKGLFPSNTHYAELFSHSGISAQITDKDYNILLSSSTAPNITNQDIEKTIKAPIMLGDNIRLSGKPIKNGYVLWTEDVSELSNTIAELEDLDEELMDQNLVLQEEYETKHKRQSLVEKNRLYNQMQNQTKDKIFKLNALVEELAKTKNKKQETSKLLEISVITAYLKRRNNLILITEENEIINSNELIFCIKETLNVLDLFGVQGEVLTNLDETLPFAQITTIFDAFENIIETTMLGLKQIFVSITKQNEDISLRVGLECEKDLLEAFDKSYMVVQEDENEWIIEFIVKGAK